jgi:lipoate-protein ligase A
MKIKLRVIHDTGCTAAFNMAADSYLLSVCPSLPYVFLRFYAWDTPSITIGYMQNQEKLLDLEAMNRDGVSWIRRPTGGRAVLHYNDITYSCVFSKQISEMGTDIADTYHLISQCLMKGLSLSRIPCSTHNSLLDPEGVRREVKLPCFLAPNRNEIMVDGRKLVGSAQKRTAEAVLQHGSIPLTGYFRKLPLYQKTSEKERTVYTRLLQDKCTCIHECLEHYQEEDIVRNLIDGFNETLPFDMEYKNWTDEELKEINH